VLEESRGKRYYREHRDSAIASNKKWKQNNREAVLERQREVTRRRTVWFKGFHESLKAAQGCSVCGTHEGVLAHHHIDRESKRYKVSQMATCSLEALLDEIAKCTVLCMSCHGRLHRTEQLRGGLDEVWQSSGS
jgi:hypothetical protein